MNSTLIIQQIFNAFSLGSMYALIAVGYTMVYGVLRLINFAHGDIMMIGAYACLFAMTNFTFPFIPAFGFGIILCICLGISIDKIAYKPLRTAPKISLLITAIGVSFFLENIINVLFTSTPQPIYVPEWLNEPFTVNNIRMTLLDLIIPITTSIALILILYILYKTKYGIAIRALAFDITTVGLMGIDANKIISFVFALGSMLACIGGIFWSAKYPQIDPNMGVLIGLKAFGAAVLGGIGSVGGAVLGGLIIGCCEVLIVAFVPDLAGFKDGFAFIFLVFILLFKPTGILGKDFEKNRF